MENWQSLLSALQVGRVMDLTPGSGSLAEACMLNDMPFLGSSAIRSTTAGLSTQRLQNTLIKDYTLNLVRVPIII